VISHRMKHTAAGAIYRLGPAPLDLDAPEVRLKHGAEQVFGPHEPSEQRGDVD